MGYIDEISYTLGCKSCGTSEARKVLDKGSAWGGSNWQEGAKFDKFQTKWIGGEDSAPRLEAAFCSQCGSPAAVSEN